jgi:hypothetical protein
VHRILECLASDQALSALSPALAFFKLINGLAHTPEDLVPILTLALFLQFFGETEHNGFLALVAYGFVESVVLETKLSQEAQHVAMWGRIEVVGIRHRLAIQSIEKYLIMPELSTGSQRITEAVGEVVTLCRLDETQQLVVDPL